MIAILKKLGKRLSARVVADAGFTLVEVIIAVSLLGLVTGAGTASLLTATSAARSSSQSSRESSDAQLISAFLVKDAAAAGGTDPATGVLNVTLGLFNVGLAGCTPAGDVFLADFRWIDQAVTPHTNSASYALDTTTHQINRRACRDGVSSGDLVLGTKVSSVSVACFPAGCPVLPDVVTFTITETNDPNYSASAFTYALTAQFRPQSQAAPSSLNSGAVPLLALGGATCPPSGAFLNVNGNAGLVVQLGGAVVNVAPPPGCSAMSISGSGSYSADSTSILSPGGCSGAACPSSILGYSNQLANPLASLPPPPNAGACAVTVGNPPLTGAGHYQAGVYKNSVTIGPGVTAVFDAGIYIFCAGLDIKGTVNAPNVLFYFAGGSLSVNASANITLGSQTSGTYANVSMWLSTALPVFINGGAGIDSYKGIIYAPLAVVSISGGSNLQLGSVIAYAIDLGGNGFTTLGPGVTITTADLPPAFVGVAFTVTLTAAAGVAPYHNWTATGLPAGLTINAASGVISGTPTTAGIYPVVVGVTDTSSPTQRTVARSYTLNVGSGALTIASPAALLGATLNTNYSATIVASGGTGGYSWSATGLPNGLLLGGLSGVISGSPTATGTFLVTVTVTDGAAFTVTKNYSLVVNDLPVFGLPLTLPASTVGATYLANPTVSFASAPFTWAASPNLPAGLTIDPASGLLNGTPTVAGTTSNVLITVTDRNGAAANRAYTIVINPAPVITAPVALPGWAVGPPAYPNTTLTATGGTGSYAWSWTAPILPPGLTLNATTGVISGTPTSAGTFGSIVTKATDSVGVSATRTYTLTITGALSINAPATMPNWDSGSVYPNTMVTVAGGSGGLVWISSTLPPGLVINAISGVISGTPTTAGSYPTVVVKATDSNGVVATRSYSLTIHSPLAFSGPGSLATWISATAYPSLTMTASGGSGSNSWSATGLPAGLSISSGGVISGTPTSTGSSAAINLTVVDTTGGSLTVGPFSITILQPLVIDSSAVPSVGVVGSVYNGSLSATGGSGNFTWSATGLPAGLTLSSTGVLSGTPTTNASYSTSITLTDNGTGPVGGPPATKTLSLPITISTPLGWGALPTPPAAWTAGFTFPTQTYTVTGGAAPVTWVITGLPAGMQSTLGAISGTPTVAGATTVTVKATDSIGQTLTRTFSLTINVTLTLSQSSTPAAAWTVGRPYPSVTYTSSGGTPAVTVTASGVPVGMTFAAGALSGTPTAAGSSTVTVTASDMGGGIVVRTFTLTINPAPILSGTLAIAEQSLAYSGTLNLAGGTAPVTWTAPTKPAFLTMNASTGVLTGTSSSAGSFPVTVTVTDATGATSTANVTLTVRPPTPISVALNNRTGTVKKIDEGDTIVVTFSQALDLTTVCPGSTLPLNGNNNVLVTINNGAGAANDTVIVSAAKCTGVGGLKFGSIDLGSGAFVTATATFGANGGGNDSTITWSATTLTITLGKQNGGTTAAVSAANTATYTPDAAMKSSLNVTVSGTSTVTGSSPNFFF